MNKRISLILYLLLSAFFCSGQISVRITADRFEGCSPQIINFGCEVTGVSGEFSYLWLSGNGDQSTLSEPSFSYQEGGNYTVSLTITAGTQTVTDTREITIYNSPQARFTNNSITGCTPLPVSFTDMSIAGDAPINSWLWFFGDGHSSIEQNPQHTYENSGNLTVSLIIIDENSCEANYDSQMINVSSSPQVTITAENNLWCVAPHATTLTADIITAPNVNVSTNVLWNFGDGGNGSGHTVTHTYNNLGYYDVETQVRDSYGCETTVVSPRLVQLAEIAPQIDVPRDVCKDVSYQYKNLVSGTECLWEFGDGTSSTNAIASHYYSNQGSYTVTFTVDPNGSCRNDTSFNINVQYVEASCIVDNNFSCDYPFTVNFTNTSVGDDISYRYDFDYNDLISTDENPRFTYQQNGVYETKITAYSSAGCTNTADGPTIIVNHPEAYFTSSSCGNCVPYSIDFTKEFVYTRNSAIVNFLWDFGDGSTAETTTSSISHTYTEIGDYAPTLTITDTSGCVVTAYLNEHNTRCDTIQIGRVIDSEEFGVMAFNDGNYYYIDNDTICPQTEYFFYNSMYRSVDSLDFNMIITANGNSSNSIVNLRYNPVQFSLDTGWNYVGMEIKYKNCVSPTYWWDSVYVLPPIIHMATSTHCSAPFDFTYEINDNRGMQYYDWAIVNGSNDTIHFAENCTAENFEFVYPHYGNYNNFITAYNDDSGCTFKIQKAHSIDSLPFDWQMLPDTVCQNDYSSADIILYAPQFVQIAYDWYSENIPIDSLEWFNITTSLSHPYRFERAGNQQVTVYLRQADSCISKYTLPLYVVDPTSTITPESSIACLPANFQFECFLPNTNDPIRNIVWNLGTEELFYDNNPITANYTNIGDYSIYYQVTTKHGCTHSQRLDNYISVIDIPDLDISFDDSICLGQPEIYTANVTNEEFWYEWNFGDGTIISTSEHSLNYQHTTIGQFPITLKVVGGIGCTDSIRYENGIFIESLEASFSLLQNYYDCYPAEAGISIDTLVRPEGTPISYHWNMGNGDNLYVAKPDYLYNQPGTYNITLEATTPAGCRIMQQQQIQISGPYAEIQISDTAICTGNTVHLSMINAQNVSYFQWVVGGGYTYNTPEVQHVYEYVPQSGNFPIVLSIQNGNCNVELSTPIYVYNIKADFDLWKDTTIVNQGYCEPLIARLIDNSSGHTNLSWNINSNIQSNEQELNTNWYSIDNQETNYTVTLVASSDIGCTDSITKQYIVYPLPELIVSNDTIICSNTQSTISASGATTYYWQIPIEDSASLQIVSPHENATYIVEGFSENNCKSTDTILVQVLEPLEVEIDINYAEINIGDTVQTIITTNSEQVICNYEPTTYTNGNNCDTIFFFPQETTNYVIYLADILGCSEKRLDLRIVVDKRFTLDLPTAFTPHSDDDNNKVFVRGFGIKQLQQFRIYNRWGEEIFATNNLNEGWDGTLNGKVLPIDTYSYYVEAEMFDGSIQQKKGNIVLLK